MSGPVPTPQVPPYPMQADQQIRKYTNVVAPYIGPDTAPKVIAQLDQIKNDLLGNIGDVSRIASELSRCAVMADSGNEIQSATNSLVGYWQGPASQQYTQYAGSLVSTMNSNQNVLTDIGKTLGDCLKTVYDTYAEAIRFIGNCAGDLAGLGGQGIVAALGQLIPGLDVLELSDFINKIIDILSDFVKNTADLLAQKYSLVGSYATSITSFLGSDKGFLVPSAPGEELGHTSSWVVVNRKSQS